MDELQQEKAQLFVEETKIEVKSFFDQFPSGFRKLLFALVLLAIPLYYGSRFVSSRIYSNYHQNLIVSASPAEVNPEKIQVLETQSIQSVGESYSAYARIKNPNKDLVAPDLDYTFSFYDSLDNLVGKESHSSFILAGEEKYIILPRIDLASAPAKVKVEVLVPDWKRRLSIPSVIIDASVLRAADSNNSRAEYVIEGNFKNNSVYTLKSVTLNGVIFGKDGRVIAVTQTSANTVKPQDSRGFKMVWPVQIGTLVGSQPKVFSETNILNYSNLH